MTFAGRRATSSAALLAAVSRAVDDPNAKVLRAPGSVSVVRAHAPDADPRAEAERLRRFVSEAIAQDVSAGVGGPKAGASGAHFALLQSDHALRLGRGLHGHGRTVHFDDLGPYCFVLNQPAHELQAFADRVLGPLAAGDQHGELFDTLESYLRNAGAVNLVARQLFLHRNTVRHRLRRIRKITGADLDDPDMRLALQLAILGRRALAQIAS